MMMPLYFLTYDLQNKKDYQNLYDELEIIKAERVLESTWCFKSLNTTEKSLKDYFKKFIAPDDCLLVVESASWSSSHCNKSPDHIK